jgi:hypothetical protein
MSIANSVSTISPAATARAGHDFVFHVILLLRFLTLQACFSCRKNGRRDMSPLTARSKSGRPHNKQTRDFSPLFTLARASKPTQPHQKNTGSLMGQRRWWGGFEQPTSYRRCCIAENTSFCMFSFSRLLVICFTAVFTASSLIKRNSAI